MSNRHMVLLTPTQVVEYWDALRVFISSAVGYGQGELDVDDIPELVQQERMVVTAVMTTEAIELVMVFEPIYYPRKGVLNICYAGGKGIKKMVTEHWPFVESIAKTLHCTEIQTICRDSAARLFLNAHKSSRKVYNILRVEVSNES